MLNDRFINEKEPKILLLSQSRHWKRNGVKAAPALPPSQELGGVVKEIIFHDKKFLRLELGE